MSAKEPMRLADMESGPDDLETLGRGVRELRSWKGSDAQIAALEARLGSELASNTVSGTAVLSSALLRFTMIGVGVVGLGLGTWLWWNAGVADDGVALHSAAVVFEPSHAPTTEPIGAVASPAHEPPLIEPAATVARSVRNPVHVAAARPRADKPKRASSDPEAELVLLGRAQALLDDDPNAALDVLAEHAHSYAHGVFNEEREVLALEAESKLGHKALARQRAERFIAQYPRSAHARRVRTLLEPEP